VGRFLIEFDRLTFGGRLDATGIRGKGLDRPLVKRPSDFPYDRPIFYGTPQAYDRGNGGSDSGGAHGQITPKDTGHSAWDDANEAAGTPMNFRMSGSPDVGGATGMPGADGGWANSPPKPWDEDDEEPWLESYLTARNYTPDGEHPQPEEVPDSSPPRNGRGLVSSSPLSDPSLMGGGSPLPSDIMIVGTNQGFSQGFGPRSRNIRTVGGLMPKESAWDALVRAFSLGQ
jgi:hypothetical protein